MRTTTPPDSDRMRGSSLDGPIRNINQPAQINSYNMRSDMSVAAAYHNLSGFAAESWDDSNQPGCRTVGCRSHPAFIKPSGYCVECTRRQRQVDGPSPALGPAILSKREVREIQKDETAYQPTANSRSLRLPQPPPLEPPTINRQQTSLRENIAHSPSKQKTLWAAAAPRPPPRGDVDESAQQERARDERERLIADLEAQEEIIKMLKAQMRAERHEERKQRKNDKERRKAQLKADAELYRARKLAARTQASSTNLSRLDDIPGDDSSDEQNEDDDEEEDKDLAEIDALKLKKQEEFQKAELERLTIKAQRGKFEGNVRIVAAAGLKSSSWRSGVNSFVLITWNGHEYGRTFVKTNNARPRWDHNIKIDFGAFIDKEAPPEDAQLHLDLYIVNSGVQEFIGRTTLDSIDIRMACCIKEMYPRKLKLLPKTGDSKMQAKNAEVFLYVDFRLAEEVNYNKERLRQQKLQRSKGELLHDRLAATRKAFRV